MQQGTGLEQMGGPISSSMMWQLPDTNVGAGLLYNVKEGTADPSGGVHLGSGQQGLRTWVWIDDWGPNWRMLGYIGNLLEQVK
jgi:hypothetical protein